MTKEDVLTKLAESRQTLRQATQGLSEEEMTQVQVEGVWTIKDVLGHIASWEEICLEPLRPYADGKPFQVEDIKDYLNVNQGLVDRKQDTSLDAILDEWDAIRQELAATISKLSAEQWEQRVVFPWGDEGTVTELLDELYEHELEHARAIQQWREDRAG
ncbi:MAG TPA: DinB family protein [Thermoflexia bacterium]|nr:DinB family protein [Thermoflexia bacterium]